MHELSIAMAVIDEVTKQVAGAGGGRVLSITLRIGRLSMVQEGTLRSSFDLASAGTELLGARLEIIDVPVRIWCPDCSAERELPGIQRFACPECGRLSGDIRAGRELDLEIQPLVGRLDADHRVQALDDIGHIRPLHLLQRAGNAGPHLGEGVLLHLAPDLMLGLRCASGAATEGGQGLLLEDLTVGRINVVFHVHLEVGDAVLPRMFVMRRDGHHRMGIGLLHGATTGSERIGLPSS